MTLMNATIKCNVCDKTISYTQEYNDSLNGWTKVKRVYKSIKGTVVKNLDFCSDTCFATWAVNNLQGITYEEDEKE